MMTTSEAIALFTTILCAFIDARTGLIPNRVTYPAFATIAGISIITGKTASCSRGAIIVGGTLLLLHLITRKRGLGLGDVKLGVCIGAALGPGGGTIALVASFIVGGALAAYWMLIGRAQAKQAVAFGPFLAIGTLLSTAVRIAGSP